MLDISRLTAESLLELLSIEVGVRVMEEGQLIGLVELIPAFATQVAELGGRCAGTALDVSRHTATHGNGRKGFLGGLEIFVEKPQIGVLAVCVDTQ